ncbi:glycoside hydrolase family 2 TIM barrel-domain containing protein [Sphingobium sp.]|uniref:glycoside hydrolase family 2 TIM barrel-domain containing protein n=1 Tax=Sphingobium sp. TaxID=1912891 RepID=UPI003B3BD75D
MATLFPSMPARAERISLSQDWRFHKGAADGAQATDFQDASWRPVAVPHDWAIEDRPDGSPPFERSAKSGQDYGYLSGGTGWYRRELQADAAMLRSVVQLRFEAIYMNADIWLNGEHLTQHHYGYSAFAIDLTGKLKPGRNVIAIRVNHEDPSSRWYAGSGIIRPAHLEVLDRLHIDPDGVALSTPVATADKGQVAVGTTIVNRTGKSSPVVLTTSIRDALGRVVATAQQRQTLKPGQAVIPQTLTVERPHLWSPDSPNLYTLVQEVGVGGSVTDRRTTRFGIRTISIDAQQGLRINGQPIKLRGGNFHHDNYMIGAAGWPDADARKVALMKDAGYNAIRSAHNPASQATLDAADELGLLVIDEAFDMWENPKREKDYARFFATDWHADLDSLVVSGRNHPSVIAWSIGNEIPEQGTAKGIATAHRLANRVRELDPTRPVTQGINIDSPQNTGSFATDDVARHFAELDIAGYNYRAHLFEKDHRNFPDRVMYTSESLSKEAFPYWRAVETMPWVIGDFVWTAFDYLGESGIGWTGFSHDWKKLAPYPFHLAYAGEIDATGRKRPAAYYREIVWKTGSNPIAAFVQQPAGTQDLPGRDMYDPPAPLDWRLDDVHPSWTWPGQEGRPLDVVVYSAYPRVELRLNDRVVGRADTGIATEYKARFKLPYAPGILTATGLDENGKPLSSWTLRTAGRPASVRVTIDRDGFRANGEDLIYVTAQLVDANGTPIYAQGDDLPIRFTASGAGAIRGAAGGNPALSQSLTSGSTHSFHGRAVAVLQSKVQAGSAAITVQAGQLPPVRINVRSISGR